MNNGERMFRVWRPLRKRWVQMTRESLVSHLRELLELTTFAAGTNREDFIDDVFAATTLHLWIDYGSITLETLLDDAAGEDTSLQMDLAVLMSVWDGRVKFAAGMFRAKHRTVQPNGAKGGA